MGRTSSCSATVLAARARVYALNFLDRPILNVLVEPIKKEFVLSDTTMGLLAGFGFVLFYSLPASDRALPTVSIDATLCLLEPDDGHAGSPRVSCR